MEACSPPRETGERREPLGLTTADLLLLVVGFALAFTLPQLHHLDDGVIEIGAIRIPMPGWSAELLILQEVAMKSALAVVPVILVRRFRYGGLPGPGDWLAFFVPLLWFREAVFRSGVIRRFARWYLVDVRSWLGFSVEALSHGTIQVGDRTYVGYEGFPVGFTPLDEHRLWCGFAVVVFLGLSTALGIGRRWIPVWLKPVILSVAAFAAMEIWIHLPQPYLNGRWYAFAQRVAFPKDLAFQVAIGLSCLPEGVLFGVVLVAAFIDLGRGGRKRWVWTGWVGLAAALTVLAAGVGIDESDLSFQLNLVAGRQFAMLLLRWFLAGFVGWIIVRCAGRAPASTT